MNEHVVFKDRPDARAAPFPADRPRRKPLGLRPVPDDDTKPRGAARSASDDPLAALIGDLVDTLEDTRKHFELKIANLETKVAKVEGENEALKLTVEHARAATRGEPGVAGPRGVAGRDGLQGPIGPRGPIGAAGKAAPEFVTWAIDDAGFVATPVFTDGVKPAGALRLMSMFSAYHRQAEATEEDESSP